MRKLDLAGAIDLQFEVTHLAVRLLLILHVNLEIDRLITVAGLLARLETAWRALLAQDPRKSLTQSLICLPVAAKGGIKEARITMLARKRGRFKPFDRFDALCIVHRVALFYNELTLKTAAPLSKQVLRSSSSQSASFRDSRAKDSLHDSLLLFFRVQNARQSGIGRLLHAYLHWPLLALLSDTLHDLHLSLRPGLSEILLRQFELLACYNEWLLLNLVSRICLAFDEISNQAV